MLHPVPKLPQHNIGDIERILTNEINANTFGANQSYHLLNLLFDGRRDVGEPELHALFALPAVDRERAGGMHPPPAILHERGAEFLTGGAEGDGIDARAVGGFEPHADMRLTGLLGIGKRVRGQR